MPFAPVWDDPDSDEWGATKRHEHHEDTWACPVTGGTPPWLRGPSLPLSLFPPYSQQFFQRQFSCSDLFLGALVSGEVHARPLLLWGSYTWNMNVAFHDSVGRHSARVLRLECGSGDIRDVSSLFVRQALLWLVFSPQCREAGGGQRWTFRWVFDPRDLGLPSSLLGFVRYSGDERFKVGLWHEPH